MSRFLRLDNDDPVEEFLSACRRLRTPIGRAYLDAFEASDRSNECADKAKALLSGATQSYQRGDPIPLTDGRPVADVIADLYSEAYAQDLYCDVQSAVVALFADNVLQRLRSRTIRTSNADGYGPEYNGVKLTKLLRATTASIRHVSEWEELDFPYLTIEDASSGQRDALRTIAVLKQAFGIGIHERIRDPVSWRTVVRIDGLYGTNEPDYRRFERAVFAAAKMICDEAGIAVSDVDKLTTAEAIL